jgi:hypothetical protein
MRRLDLTLSVYVSVETKKRYHARSGRVTLPDVGKTMARLLPAGLKAAARRMGQDARQIARQGEVALALLGIAGRSLAWGLT